MMLVERFINWLKNGDNVCRAEAQRIHIAEKSMRIVADRATRLGETFFFDPDKDRNPNFTYETSKRHQYWIDFEAKVVRCLSCGKKYRLEPSE